MVYPNNMKNLECSTSEKIDSSGLGIDSRFIIVTGGAGFIGSAVLKELNKRGLTRIVIFDDLGQGCKWKNLVGNTFCDILHKNDIHTWLHDHLFEVSTIIHLGACSTTTEKDASYLLENNYRYSRKLAEFSFSHQIRFIYASSAATYGGGECGFSDDYSFLEKLRPLNMYGYSKHMFDLWLLREGFLDRVVGLKYFNVFGPNEWHKGRMASAIVRMVPEILQTGKIQLFKSHIPSFADGEQKRDFIYVKDVAEVTCDFVQSKAVGIFNVGTGEAISWNRLARAVFSSLDREPRIEYIPMPDDLVGTYQYFTQADTRKIESCLQRKVNRYSFEDAVDDYVKQYLVKGFFV